MRSGPPDRVMSEAYPYIEIITLCYNNKKYLQGSFAAIEKLDYPKDKISLNILDNGFAVDGMTVPKSGKIQSMSVYLDVTHTFVNDLVFTLEQESTSKKLTLIRNPVTSGGGVCSGDNIDVWLADIYSTPVNNSCLTSLIPTISGYRRPYMLLVPYNGEQMAGNWQMVASDTRAGDSGRLNVWCLEFTYSQ